MLNYINKIFYFLFLFLFSQAIAQDSLPTHFVSFIIPCYNCANTVEESIESIYQQDLNCPFEVVCTDDGSSDETKMVLEACVKKYPYLFVYSHDRNRGGGAARNTCIYHAKGDLIFCLDSDNILTPKSVNGLVALIDQTGCDIAVFNGMKVFATNSDNINHWEYSSSPETTILDLVSFITCNPAYNPAHSGNYLFTRRSYDRAGGYPEEYGAVDTTAFGLAQLATGSKMALLPNHFYWHRYSVVGYWNRSLHINDANLHKLLISYSEVLSDEINLYLSDENLVKSMPLFGKYSHGGFTPASPIILESLFKAYAYKEKKKYAEAAIEFANAINAGCKSQKIFQYMKEMENLEKVYAYSKTLAKDTSN